MDRDKKPFVRRPEVLKKLNAENLHFIERGLLEELPERLRPVPPRSQSNELHVAKPSLLSACLQIVPETPMPYTGKTLSVEENASPLRKSFSFRDKFRFFGKDKTEKPKWKTIVEEEKVKDPKLGLPAIPKDKESDNKSNKRFWFFRNKDLADNRERNHSPIYLRSKSFEFLPRATQEAEEAYKKKLINSQSYAYGSSDGICDITSNEGSEYENEVFYNTDNTIYLKSIKELHDSDHNSSASTATSASSGIVLNIFKRESVQDLLQEFDKAVDMFSENYSSDCEPYTKSTGELSIKEKRKSASFNTLPSPKILQLAKTNKVSENFKNELSKMLDVKRESACAKYARRGSVTDWFVLEDKNLPMEQIPTLELSDANRYRRAQKKQRVRRISSTKYESSASRSGKSQATSTVGCFSEPFDN